MATATATAAQADAATELAEMSAAKQELRGDLAPIKLRQEEQDLRLAKEIELINKAFQVLERDVAESSATAARALERSSAGTVQPASPSISDGELLSRSIEEGVPPMLDPTHEVEHESNRSG